MQAARISNAKLWQWQYSHHPLRQGPALAAVRLTTVRVKNLPSRQWLSKVRHYLLQRAWNDERRYIIYIAERVQLVYTRTYAQLLIKSATSKDRHIRLSDRRHQHSKKKCFESRLSSGHNPQERLDWESDWDFKGLKNQNVLHDTCKWPVLHQIWHNARCNPGTDTVCTDFMWSSSVIWPKSGLLSEIAMKCSKNAAVIFLATVYTCKSKLRPGRGHEHPGEE